MTDFLYRFENRLVSAGVDEFDNSLGPPRVSVVLRKLKILKTTPTGFWVQVFFTERRFVKAKAHKRYACPTPEEALESFRARKNRQVSILLAQVARAREALFMAERGMFHGA